MDTASTQQIVFSDGVCFQSLGASDDGVLLSMRTGQLYRCNPVATAFLAAVKEGASRRDAVDRVVSIFEVSVERAEADLNELVGDLIGQQLLERAA